jgi:hypothetical protein
MELNKHGLPEGLTPESTKEEVNDFVYANADSLYKNGKTLSNGSDSDKCDVVQAIHADIRYVRNTFQYRTEKQIEGLNDRMDKIVNILERLSQHVTPKHDDPELRRGLAELVEQKTD